MSTHTESPNFQERTIWIGDNLDILRGINSSCVDLVYLDPPFRSESLLTAHAEHGGGFKEKWSPYDLDPDWEEAIAIRPAVQQALDAAAVMHSESMRAYLGTMGLRLIELHRVLKQSGSIYLHCGTADVHYLKLLMDSVFGKENFRNEVSWHNARKRAVASRGYPRGTDLLLHYSVSQGYTWNQLYLPPDPSYVRNFYRYVDADTGRRYRLGDLIHPRAGDVDLTYEWRGHTRTWRWPRERMQQAHDEGRVHYSSTGLATLKRYLDEVQGVPVDAVWDDIQPLNARHPEYVGLRSQKPLALMERIIGSSSNPGDVVLDPFCGSATTCIAAETMGRRWMGVDISSESADIADTRLRQSIGAERYRDDMLHVRRDTPPRVRFESRTCDERCAVGLRE